MNYFRGAHIYFIIKAFGSHKLDAATAVFSVGKSIAEIFSCNIFHAFGIKSVTFLKAYSFFYIKAIVLTYLFEPSHSVPWFEKSVYHAHFCTFDALFINGKRYVHTFTFGKQSGYYIKFLTGKAVKTVKPDLRTLYIISLGHFYCRRCKHIVGGYIILLYKISVFTVNKCHIGKLVSYCTAFLKGFGIAFECFRCYTTGKKFRNGICHSVGKAATFAGNSKILEFILILHYNTA